MATKSKILAQFLFFWFIATCLVYLLYCVHFTMFPGNTLQGLFESKDYEFSEHSELRMIAIISSFGMLVFGYYQIITFTDRWHDANKQLLKKRHIKGILYTEINCNIRLKNELAQLEQAMLHNTESSVQTAQTSVLECVVCMDNERTHLAFPCRHYCVCKRCMKQECIADKCPICRADVSLWIRVYK